MTSRPPRRGRLVLLATTMIAAAVAVVVATAPAPAVAGPAPVIRAYVPLPTNDFQAYLESINTAADSTIRYTVGVTNQATGAVIYYDHREDGFEADIANPVQSSTQVFGDANTANGNAATYCGARCAGDTLPQGAALIMRNDIPTPRTSAVFFDGGDKVASTRGFVVTAGGFSTPLNSVLSGVVSSYDTTKYGRSFTAPVGENTPVPTGTTHAFSYTGASIMAASPGTVVAIDRNADGTSDETHTLGEGSSVLVHGGLSQGARITASNPVQVHLLTGRRASGYEARSFTLFSDELLTNDYISPAGSGRGNYRTVNYVHNPGTASITVTPTCAGCTGTFTVAAGATSAYPSPVNQAVRFTTSGAPFVGIAGVGSQSGAAPGGGTNEAANWDWGFTMLPTAQLTTQVALGWAPGNSNVPPTTTGNEDSYNPVWVSTLAATTLHVDFDGDPTTGAIAGPDCIGARHDRAIAVTALATTKIADTADGDMTGARIYACDGTKVAGAWGEDATLATAGAPGFDAGYTIIPTTAMVVEKSATLADDVDLDGGFGPGDTMTYEISIADAGSLAFTEVTAEDILPAGIEYVAGSTRITTSTATIAIADDSVPPATTPFPLDEGGGLSLPDIAAGDTVTLRFDTRITEPWALSSATIGNTACVRAAEATSCDTDQAVLSTADVSLSKQVTGTAPSFVGQNVTFRLGVANAGPDVAAGVDVTDVLPAGLAFRSASPSVGTYDETTGVWAVGNVAVGATPTLDVTARVETADPVTNYAEVTSMGSVDIDSQPAEGPLGVANPPDQDDEAAAPVDVAPRVDLSVVKAVTDGPLADGTTAFTVSVANDYPIDATGVVVTDHLPAGATFVSATPSVGSYDGATGVWTVGTVAGGESEALVIRYRLSTFPATNRVEVTDADQVDVDSQPAEGPLDAANPPDQDDEAAVTATSSFIDLSVTKSVDPPAFIGEDATFNVTVSNAGPIDATGVAITDPLPAGLTFRSASTATGSYDSVSGVWAVGSVPVGTTRTLTIVARVDIGAQVTNVAEVENADQPDRDSTPANAGPGEDDQASAGLQLTGASVGDRVWDDADGDGVQDPAEPGLNGVGVTLLRDVDGDGGYETTVATTSSGADGAYTFTDLPAGDYRVVVGATGLPAGFVATTATTVDRTLAAGESVTDADVGFSDDADLRLEKSLVAPLPAYVGDAATFAITVTNDGPATATGVVVSDVLAPALDHDPSTSATQGAYDPLTGLWAVGELAEGDSATLLLTVIVRSEASITNTAQLHAADQDDPGSTPGDDQGLDDLDTATVDVDPLADLSLTKDLDDDAPISVGDDVTFTLTVANAGPSTATGVTVSDPLPAGLTFRRATGAGSYDADTGEWTVGNVPADSSASIDIVATVTVPSVTNEAEIATSDQDDPDSTPGDGSTTDDDDDTATVTATPRIDLALVKAATSPTFVGQDATFTLTLTNTGPSPATGVTVADLLPAGLTFVAATPSQGAYDDQTGVWAVGGLPAATGSATVLITARLEVVGPLRNIAEVATADQADVDSTPGNGPTDPAEDDRSSVEVSAVGGSIGDRVWDDTDADGVQDDGEPGLVGVTVNLVRDLDGDGTYEAAVATTTTGTDGAYSFDDLAPGSYRVVVDATTSPAGAVATTDTGFAVTLAPGQVVDTADAGFTTAADLELTKVLTDGPTYVGDTATFEVTITNNGPATATGVVVSDPQPAGLLFQTVVPSHGTYDADTGLWSVGTLIDGQVETLTVVARVDVSNPLTNVAVIDAVDQPDPKPGDEGGDADVDVDPLVDVEVSKVLTDTPTYLGQDATYEVLVANRGPSAATGVELTDLLPTGLTLVSADPSVGTYDPDTGLWTIGTLAANTTVTLEVVATVEATTTTNTAEITATVEDDRDSTPGNGATQTPEDDRASVELTVDPRVDLELAKDGRAPTFAGQDATFTLSLVNRGPSVATGVQVRDLLPAGLTYVSADPSVGTYDPDTGVWAVGTVAVGTDAGESLTITASLDVTSPVTNVAEVTAADQDDVDSTPANGATPTPEDDRDDATISAGGGTIGDRVWVDVSFDGGQGPGEPGLNGVTVTLLRDTDGDGTYETTVATATTAGDGNYSFDGLVPGDYRVVVDEDTAPGDHIATTDTTFDVELAPGQVVDDADSGFTPVADIRLTKVLGPDGAPTHVGDQATFVIDVINDGPADATGVVVADLLPAGLAFVSADPSDGSYDAATGTWTIGRIPNRQRSTLTVVATVRTDAPVENTAEVVEADRFDPTSTPGNGDPDEHDQDTVEVDVDPLADLSVAKVVTDEPRYVGDQVGFDVRVRNAGPSGATGVEVTDLLPAGLTFVSADPSDGTYDAATGIWTVGDLADQGVATLAVRATISALTATNTAELTGADQDDPNSTPGNDEPDEDDQSSVDISVDPLIDLSLAKAETARPDHIGDTARFTVTVVNDGPSDATGVEVTDLLPAGLTFESADPSVGTYDAATGIWTVGDLPVRTSATLTVEAVVEAFDVTNVAEITGAGEDDTDSVPANGATDPEEDDRASARVQVDALADLSVTKLLTDSPTYLGDEAAFTVTVTNDGPSDATGVEVTDLLPAGFTFVSADPSVGTYDAATGIWTVGDLANRGRETLAIVVEVIALAATNAAEVTAADQDDPDSTPANGPQDPAEDDRGVVDVVVAPLADLTLTKEVSATPTFLGDEATFTITVSNAGPSDATGVQVTDRLPAGLSHVGDDGAGSYDPTTGVWAVGTVSARGSRTLSITVEVDTLSVENFAEVTAANEDDPTSQPGEGPLGPDARPDQDDEDVAGVVVAPVADLRLDKRATAEPLLQGDEATFTITVHNDGPSDATGTTVVDQLPAGVTFVSADPSVGTYDEVTGVWTIGDLADGATETLLLVVTVDTAGDVVNTASIATSDQHDPDSTPGGGGDGEDDIDNATLSSDPVIDLSLTKDVSASSVDIGGEVDFTVGLANDGPSDATGVEVTDLLPSGLVFVGAAATVGTYDPATGIWTVGDLAEGGTASLTITVSVDGTTSVSNVAEVSAADQVDSDSQPVEGPLGPGSPPDQDDEDEASVSGIAIDLSVTKTADVATAGVGGPATYTVTVTNDGPSAATGVTVVDLLPAGVTHSGSLPSRGSYDVATGNWTIGDIAVDETVALQVVVTVADAGATINTAEVATADQPDLDSTPGNGDPDEDDQASVTLTGELIDLSLLKEVSAADAALGGEVVYTITVGNDGPSTATGVVVADGLPDGLQWVRDSGQGTYDAGTGLWALGALAPGETTSLRITTLVTARGPITNVAQVVAADQPDIDSLPGNDDPDEDDEDAVAIDVEVASLRGAIWLDTDGDGRFDDDESPIGGVTVLLYDADGNLVASTTTDDDGRYLFTDLLPGMYSVVVDEATLPATIDGQSYDPDDVADGRTTVTLESGEARTGVDFGYQPPAGEPPAVPIVPSVPIGPSVPTAPPGSSFDPTDPGSYTTENLARTGQDSAPLVAAGLGLLLAGAALTSLVRRRFGTG